MKFSLFALLVGSAAAYTAPTMTFAVGKKAPKKVKKSPPKKPVPTGTVPSKALPFEEAPAALDGSLPGDVGFDPCFLTTKADIMANYFNSLSFIGRPNKSGLFWYREAEIAHGRLAQMAVVGFIVPGLVTFPGLEYTTPFGAISAVPLSVWAQLLGFMALLDIQRCNIIKAEGDNYMNGDIGFGQGEGRYNPFKFNYSDEEYFEKQVQELKHGRVAMIALVGQVFQANVSGMSVVDQLSGAFSFPENVAKAGYFLPEGI